MDRRSPGRIIAGCFALSGFAVAIFASLGAGANVDTILLRAILALVSCAAVGAVIGMVAERCISDGFNEYAAKHPVPELPTILVSPVNDTPRGNSMPASGGGRAS